jgi:large subunit ribosomal protein L30
MSKIGVIRIRSEINAKQEVKNTLIMLKLGRKNSCAVVSNTKPYIGMIKKVKDYVTWGELDKDTLTELIKQRAKLAGNKRLTETYLKEKTGLTVDKFAEELFNEKKSLKDVPGLKSFFKLKAPEGGFERGGVKRAYSMGGVLGYRKENINNLIRKML